MKKIILAALVLLVTSFPLEGCRRSATLHYRVTIVIDEQGVKRIGSGVWGYTLSEPFLSLASPYNFKAASDAIPIYLSDGGVLLALPACCYRNPSSSGNLPENVWSEDGVRSSNRLDDVERIYRLKGDKKNVICPYYQISGNAEIHKGLNELNCLLFAYTAEPGDSAKLHLIDPSTMQVPEKPSLQIRVVRVTLTIVDEPITRQVGRALPWATDTYFKNIHGYSSKVGDQSVAPPFLRSPFGNNE